MSMYNLVHGENAAADFLLGVLNLTRKDVGRFRDAWVTEKGEIAVYTRNGGGNRECSGADELASEACDCCGCAIEFRLPKHPLYEMDEDDDFDSTYATVFFRVPEEAKSLLSDLAQKRDPDAEWLKAIDAMKQGKRPDVEAMLAPFVEAILKAVR